MPENNIKTNSQTSNMSPKPASASTPKYIAVAILGAILVFGLAGWYVKNNNDETKKKDDIAAQRSKKDDDEKMKRDDMMKKMDKQEMSKETGKEMKMSKDEPTNPSANLSGIYTGQAALLTQSLGFPKSTFSLNSADMTLDAEGLDLALLQRPEFQVGGVYPKVKLAAKGKVSPKADDTVDLIVTSLTPMFVVMLNGTETPVDSASSQAILIGLSKVGIVIPTISESAPATISATINATTTGISIKSTSTSPLFAMFEGAKVG